jgi:hypothetical protein
MSPNRSASLEQLEGAWPDPGRSTNLVETCYRLRRMPLGELTAESLRMLIGQGIGLVHLLPLAFEKLEANPFAEGTMYEGDLLHSVVRVPSEFWALHDDLRQRLDELIATLHNQVDFLNKSVFPEWQRIYGGR